MLNTWLCQCLCCCCSCKSISNWCCTYVCERASTPAGWPRIRHSTPLVLQCRSTSSTSRLSPLVTVTSLTHSRASLTARHRRASLPRATRAPAPVTLSLPPAQTRGKSFLTVLCPSHSRCKAYIYLAWLFPARSECRLVSLTPARREPNGCFFTVALRVFSMAVE